MSSELRIGDVKIENRLILAPMAGMLRLSLRMAYRRSGCAMTCVGVVGSRAVAHSDSWVVLWLYVFSLLFTAER